MVKSYIKTSEAVSTGHPDKLCDQIADAIFDHLRQFKQDPQCAVEVSAGAGVLFIFGEVDADIVKPDGDDLSLELCNPGLAEELREIALGVIREVGYQPEDYSPRIVLDVVTQSVEINRAVEESALHEAAAGDQGIVTGFAVNETFSGHALHFILAHEILKQLEQDRVTGRLPWLLPDAKSQVSVGYVYEEDGVDRPVSVENILVSQCYVEDVALSEVRSVLMHRVEEVACRFIRDNRKFLPRSDELVDSLLTADILINPAGPWHLGGPQSDSGLTGRKLVVDNYGSAASIGGGSTAGKNFNKVDRSGAYYARNIAKSIVFSGLAERCLVELGFAIGVPKAVSVNIETFGTERVALSHIYDLVYKHFDFKVKSMIDLACGVLKAADSSKHGNYTNEDFPWEKAVQIA